MYALTATSDIINQTLKQDLYNHTHHLILVLEDETRQHDPTILLNPTFPHPYEEPVGYGQYAGDIDLVATFVDSAPYTHVTVYQEVSPSTTPDHVAYDNRLCSTPVFWRRSRVERTVFHRWLACFESGDLDEIQDDVFYLVMASLLQHPFYFAENAARRLTFFKKKDVARFFADEDANGQDVDAYTVTKYTTRGRSTAHKTNVSVTPRRVYDLTSDYPVAP